MDATEKTIIDARHLERAPTQERHIDLTHANTKHAKVQSVALADAVAKDNPSNWTAARFQLYGVMIFCILSKYSHPPVFQRPELTEYQDDCMNGYDGSIMGSINAMDPFHEFFNVGMSGSGIGLVFAIYTVGNILGSLFAGTIIDVFGRKVGMLR
jgi:Sugar (and other) transporter